MTVGPSDGQPPHEWPTASVVMTVVNEERHLRHAIDRLLAQDYPGVLDIVIAVGPSRDRTREVADAIAARHDHVTVVDNPTGKTPSGLNAAIGATDSTVVVRIDGHAMVPPDYVTTGVRTLLATGADNVGGIMAAEGTTGFERAVARAMTSRFGVGGAAFHVGGDPGPALTVYLGCFRRSALERVGGYDESMVRAQDWEMNLRIRQSGGAVWFTPDMRVTYRPRHDTKALARQYHDYGRWRREVARRHPDTVSLRYLAAPVAVVGAGAGVALAVAGAVARQPWLVGLGLVAPVGYALLDLAASAQSAMTAPRLAWREAARLPAVYATMHGAWGTGFLRGVPRKAGG
ncbi:MAG: glycosyltransferase family 2 protein [Actinomycetota bacterium]|nr:glycosyltransferase family 2 protein [Actinomycetota bacterium]